jgi:hypothetical protein
VEAPAMIKKPTKSTNKYLINSKNKPSTKMNKKCHQKWRILKITHPKTHPKTHPETFPKTLLKTHPKIHPKTPLKTLHEIKTLSFKNPLNKAISSPVKSIPLDSQRIQVALKEKKLPNPNPMKKTSESLLTRTKKS